MKLRREGEYHKNQRGCSGIILVPRFMASRRVVGPELLIVFFEHRVADYWIDWVDFLLKRTPHDVGLFNPGPSSIHDLREAIVNFPVIAERMRVVEEVRVRDVGKRY